MNDTAFKACSKDSSITIRVTPREIRFCPHFTIYSTSPFSKAAYCSGLIGNLNSSLRAFSSSPASLVAKRYPAGSPVERVPANSPCSFREVSTCCASGGGKLPSFFALARFAQCLARRAPREWSSSGLSVSRADSADRRSFTFDASNCAFSACVLASLKSRVAYVAAC